MARFWAPAPFCRRKEPPCSRVSFSTLTIRAMPPTPPNPPPPPAPCLAPQHRSALSRPRAADPAQAQEGLLSRHPHHPLGPPLRPWRRPLGPSATPVSRAPAGRAFPAVSLAHSRPEALTLLQASAQHWLRAPSQKPTPPHRPPGPGPQGAPQSARKGTQPTEAETSPPPSSSRAGPQQRLGREGGNPERGAGPHGPHLEGRGQGPAGPLTFHPIDPTAEKADFQIPNLRKIK